MMVNRSLVNRSVRNFFRASVWLKSGLSGEKRGSAAPLSGLSLMRP